MYTKIFTTLPQEAKNIRIEVFMKEQGFENEIKKLNGDLIVVHAQVRVSPFYEKQGYIQFGQIDDDEGVPHMWMKKKIQY